MAQLVSPLVSRSEKFPAREYINRKLLEEPARIVEFNSPTNKRSLFKNMKIGEGALGIVWEVYGIAGEGPYAIKELKQKTIYSDEITQSLALRSVHGDCLAHLVNDPNITRILEIDLSQRLVLMELLEGHSLSKIMRERTLTIDEIVHIARRTARGLRALHAKGYVHHDIKPENIFIPTSNEAKILDFGLMQEEKDCPKSVGRLFGTLLYLSPEAVFGRPTTIASDMYSFGLTLYELLVGVDEFRKTFDGGSIIDTLDLKKYFRPLTPDYMRDDVPLELSQLVMGCITRDTRQRFTANEVLTILG